MHYQGGKARVGKYIAPHIDEALLEHEGRYVEPFVGSCSLLHRYKNVSQARLLDYHEGLIGMYRAYQEGWRPNTAITEEEYRALKAANAGDPWSTFASFACSFGAKEWGGFARDRKVSYGTGTYVYIQGAHNAIKKKWEGVIDQPHVTFEQGSFFDLVVPQPSVIYCDPPYANTLKYKVGDFNNALFWEKAEELAQQGHTVLVSEFSNPHNHEVLWQRERQVTMTRDSSKNKKKTELLLKVR